MAKAKTTKSTAKSSSKKTATKVSRPAATKVRVATKKTSMFSRVFRGGRVGRELRVGTLLSELLGTFVLTVAALSTGNNAIVSAVVVMVLVMVLWRISGGHVNPVVTVAALVNRNITALKAAGFVVAQALGAMLGLVVVTQFLTGSENPFTQQPFQLQAVKEGFLPFWAEALGALVLGFGAASVFLNNKRESHEAGFVLGGALLLGLIVATLGSASVVNPALAVGLNGYTDNWMTALTYAVGPLLGGAVGAWVYGRMLKDADRA